MNTETIEDTAGAELVRWVEAGSAWRVLGAAWLGRDGMLRAEVVERATGRRGEVVASPAAVEQTAGVEWVFMG